MVRVSIYSTSSGDPSSSLYVLSNPSSLTENAINWFTAPKSATLEANTTYAVVVEESSGGSDSGRVFLWHGGTSHNEDPGGASGWSIADATQSRQEGGATWSASAVAAHIAVRGYAIFPPMPVSTATVNGTALTLNFKQALDTAAAPAGSAFTVTATPEGGMARTIAGTAAAVTISGVIARDNRTVDVVLASAVAAGEAVTVAYVKPTGANAKPLKFAGSDGDDVPEFSGQQVTNVTVADVSMPTAGALVSNTGQVDSSSSATSLTADRAQGFRSGSHEHGYTLTRVEIPMTEGTNAATFTASIRSGSQDGTKVGDLTLSGSVPAAGTAEFTAGSDGIQLARNTNYWVLLDVTSSGSDTRIRKTTSHAEDAGAAAGWSISNESRVRGGIGNEAWAGGGSQTFKIAVHGTPNPPPPAFSTATVNGEQLKVTFDRALDEDETPAGTAFTVTATPEGGTAREIQGTSAAVTIDGATATVTLASAVVRGETVTVAYAKPDTNPLAAADGNEVEDFTGEPVINATGTASVPTPTAGALVSNTGQADATGHAVVSLDYAQQFTTGSHPHGYRLTKVVLGWQVSGAGPGYTVSIRSGSETGTKVGDDLTKPASLPADGNAEFTAGGGIHLDPNTNYWVLIDVSTQDVNARVKQTLADAEDTGAAAGWSIHDSKRQRVDHTNGAWSDNSAVLKLAIHGTPNPPPPTEASPFIEDVLVVSYPTLDTDSPADGRDDTYIRADEILVDVVFSEPVEVTGDGSVRLRLQVGSNRRVLGTTGSNTALPTLHHGGRTLRFKHIVQPGDTDTDGVHVFTDAQRRVITQPGGATVVSAVTGATADLTALPASEEATATQVTLADLPTTGYPRHKVDGSKTKGGLGNSVGPRVTDVFVNGSVMAVHFDKNVATTGLADLKFDFLVEGIAGIGSDALGQSQSPLSVTRSSGQHSVLALELGTGARAGETVTLSYTGTALKATSAAGGRRAPRFRDFPVTNNTPGAAGPSPVRASVVASTLRVVFDGELDGSSAPAGSAFEVDTRGPADQQRRIRGTGTAVVSGSEVFVGLEGAVQADWRAQVHYRKPVRNWLRGAGTGNPAVLSFDMFSAAVDEGVPPGLLGGSVTQTGSSPAVSKVVLTFDEALDGDSTPATGDFAVTVGGTSATVSAVSVTGSNVVLTVGSAAGSGTAVAVTYTPGTDPIRDLAGNAAAGFANLMLTAGATGEPQFESASVDGTRVTLTYSLPLSPDRVPGADAFTLHYTLGLGETAADRTVYSATDVASVGVEGKTVVLRLTHPVFPCNGYNDSVNAIPFTVSYEMPDAANSRLWHLDLAEEAEEFTHQNVMNVLTEGSCLNGIFQATIGSVILKSGRPFARDEAIETGWFTVTASGGPVTVTGAAYSADEDDELTLSLDREIEPGEQVTVSYERPDDARGLWNVDGKQLSDVEDLWVENEAAPSVPPLTAEFVDVPATHGGRGSEFSFELRFSEEFPGRLDYLVLRDEALEATNARVTGVRRVRQGRNRRWTVTVRPRSDEDVTVTLPATTDCDAAGAVCTEAGRKLANTSSVTVAYASEARPARFRGAATEEHGRGLWLTFTKEILVAGVDTNYTVRVDGERRETRGAFWEDNRVGLRLVEPVRWDEMVTVAYAKPSGGDALRDVDGLDVESFGPETVANTVPQPVNRPATGAPAIAGRARVGETLEAQADGIADPDGISGARFAYQWLRDGAEIAGATGASYTLADADEGAAIRVRVTFTDDAGNGESLTSAATERVAPRLPPLTAVFEGVPAEHGGRGSEFTFELVFSENFPGRFDYRKLRDEALVATNARVTGARRAAQGRNQRWTITVRPRGMEDVTVSLPATAACGASGAVCTPDGRPLSNASSATVRGPVGISVADARVEENEGAVLSFAVSLSRAPVGTLTVDYATSDGSALAGEDYAATSGTLTFSAGESSGTVTVAVFDDSHDEGEETLTLTLSNPSPGVLTDGEATGTIVNRDPLPRALLARFGRAAAVHVVEQVEERLEATRSPGIRGRLAGRELRNGMEREVAASLLGRLGGLAGVDPAAGAGTAGGMNAAAGMGPATGLGPAAGDPVRAALGLPGVDGLTDTGGGSGRGATVRPVSALFGGGLGSGGPVTGPGAGGPVTGLRDAVLGGGDLLTDSSFALDRQTSNGGILSIWNRGARSRFSGQEGTLGLSGDVRTTMFGADWAKGPLVAGVSLSHSRGLGEYAGKTSGKTLSSVTGLYPWLGYRATERITVWGVGGYGKGGLLLTPEGGSALESELSMRMAAAGTRGELLSGGAGGYGLAFKADALWVGTSIAGVDGPSGRLAATEAAVTRFRTALEGSRSYTLAGRVLVKPSVELGLRHDGGDAETGAGVDVGVGLTATDAASGLAVDVRVRTLLAHQAEGFRERGLALSFAYNPTPGSPLGFSARVAPTWGGPVTGGAEALWGRETLARMAPGGGIAPGRGLDAEFGYGLPVGRRLVGTPRMVFRSAAERREYGFGYGLGLLETGAVRFELHVDAQRSALPGGAANQFLARAALGW
ncbi:MAG: SwmB domain-containing protein [Acidobacteria bacterium]|nr:SwmB domain-containing protein [Acidobacteriota bacterium]